MATNTKTTKITESCAIVSSTGGTATFMLKGGGGAGGSAFNGTHSPENSAAPAGGGGGGGGAAVIGTVELEANTAYRCIVGKGGQVVAPVRGGTVSEAGGDSVLYYTNQLLLKAGGGQGGGQASFGQAGNGGNGGAASASTKSSTTASNMAGGGGGGGGGESNNGFGPSYGAGSGGAAGAISNSSLGSAGGAGGPGGGSVGYVGGAGGGGGAGGADVAGGHGGTGNAGPVPNPGQGGQVTAPFAAPITAGSGLTGHRGQMNGIGCGGGGGGAARLAENDISGQGGTGASIGQATAGQDGVFEVTFDGELTTHDLAEIISFSPMSGTTGTEITITGKNFDTDPANNEITFIDSSSTTSTYIKGAKSATATELVFVIPEVLAKTAFQKHFVIITGSYSLASEPSTEAFSYYPQTTIRDFFPDTIGIGNTLTIYGQNFAPLDSQNRVFFTGGVSAVPNVSHPTELQVVVPAGTEQGKIMVQSYGLDGQKSSTDLQIQAVPELTGISPTALSARGSFTIEGDNFSVGNTQVYFGGFACLSNELSVTETQITGKVPPNAVSSPVYVIVNGVRSNSVMVTIN